MKLFPIGASLAAGLVLAIGGCEECSSTPRGLEAQVAELRGELDRSRRSLSTTSQEVGTLQEQLKNSQEQLDLYRARASSLERSLAATQNAHQELRSQSTQVSRFLQEKANWELYRENSETQLSTSKQEIESLRHQLDAANRMLQESSAQIENLQDEIKKLSRQRPHDVIGITGDAKTFAAENAPLFEATTLNYSVDWPGKGTQVGNFRPILKNRMLQLHMPLEIFDPRGSFDLVLGSTRFSLSHTSLDIQSRAVRFEFAEANDFQEFVKRNTAPAFRFSYGPEGRRSHLEFAVTDTDHDFDNDVIFHLTAIELSGENRLVWSAARDTWVSTPED